MQNSGIDVLSLKVRMKIRIKKISKLKHAKFRY